MKYQNESELGVPYMGIFFHEMYFHFITDKTPECPIIHNTLCVCVCVCVH